MPSFVDSDNSKKIANVKPMAMPSGNVTKLTNINNPFTRKLGELPFLSIIIGENSKQNSEFKLPVPGEGLPRVIHYCADQSGCGFWRMIWPGDELLAQNKAVIMTLYQMVLLAPFYQGISAIRLQRQCTPEQLKFIKFLRNVSDELKKQTGKGFRIIYECDDVIFTDMIPNYNVCKQAFLDPNIEKNVKEIIKYCDELVLPSQFMAKIYKDRLDFDKISVIPNYVPKYWMDRGIDNQRIIEKYRKNKRKPRILYAGSATHFDLMNKVNQNDDFGHVNDVIIRDLTVTKKYEWIFMGGIPARLRQFIGNGITFHNWKDITEYPAQLREIDADVMIAPLADNIFSRSKANIKLTEAGAIGIPMIAQNLDCYNSDGQWQYLFNTADEMMQQIADVVSSEHKYKIAVKKGREYAEKFWLNDHVNEWVLLYTTEYGSEKRKEDKYFYENNKEQFK